MYRTGIGPYTSKEVAVAQRPSNMRNWVLKVDAIPNTRLMAYYEILDIDEINDVDDINYIDYLLR